MAHFRILVCALSARLRYHPSIVQDAGPDAESFTTARLRRESIVFETPNGARFEISRDPLSSASLTSMSDSGASSHSHSPAGFDSYRFAQIFPSGSPLAAPTEGGDDDKATASSTAASAASKEPARKRGGRQAQKDSGAATSAVAASSSASASSSSSSSAAAGAAFRVPAAEDARLLVLHRGLDWTDFSWGADSVVVCDRPYVVHAIIFQRNTA